MSDIDISGFASVISLNHSKTHVIASLGKLLNFDEEI